MGLHGDNVRNQNVKTKPSTRLHNAGLLLMVAHVITMQPFTVGSPGGSHFYEVPHYLIEEVLFIAMKTTCTILKFSNMFT